MNDPSPLSRRTYLRALSAGALAAALAGCSGGSDGGDGGGTDDPATDTTTSAAADPTTGADGAPAFDCADLSRGSQPFDPDGRAFRVVWDYPASFADVEREMANSDALAGARLGHVATKGTGSWAFMIQLNQSVAPMDAESAERYVGNPAYDEADPIDFEGESLPRATYGSGANRTWYTAIPGDVDGEFYSMAVVLGVDSGDEYAACADAAVSVAEGIMGSFRPAP